MSIVHSDILQLSVSERIQLAEDIWDSISTAPEQLAVTKAQQDELDWRIEAYRQEPQAGASWQDVRDRLKTRTSNPPL